MPAPIDTSMDSSKVTNSCAQMSSPKLKSRMASQSILPPLTTSSLCYNFQSSYPTPVHSVTSITSGSNQDSPTISPSSYHPFINYTTAQSSPICFNSSDFDFHLTPLELPDSTVLRKTSVSAMSE